jgi:hypothetical protein
MPPAPHIPEIVFGSIILISIATVTAFLIGKSLKYEIPQKIIKIAVELIRIIWARLSEFNDFLQKTDANSIVGKVMHEIQNMFDQFKESVDSPAEVAVYMAFAVVIIHGTFRYLTRSKKE